VIVANISQTLKATENTFTDVLRRTVKNLFILDILKKKVRSPKQNVTGWFYCDMLA
jgi:hypothetical protein